jgi:hypothetical protein
MAKEKLTGTLGRSDVWLKSSYERLAVSRLILDVDKKLIAKTRELIELSTDRAFQTQY